MFFFISPPTPRFSFSSHPSSPTPLIDIPAAEAAVLRVNSLTFLSAAKEPWHAGGRGKKKKKQRRRESKQIAVKKRDGGGGAGGEVGGGARAGQQEGCIGPATPRVELFPFSLLLFFF